jgi:hypothetical protein
MRFTDASMGDFDELRPRVFARKHCASCHDSPSSGAPGRAAMADRMTSYGMVAALWKHGPAMMDRMQLQKIPWPPFKGSEMADLTTYLHGLRFKQRRPPLDTDRRP